MANKAISELPQAQNVNNQDLFVLEQSGIAKKLTAETFITEQGIIDALAEALDGHGGIQSVTLSSVSGRIRTYLITFTDGSATTFQVLDGTSIDRIVKTSTAGLVDTYTIFMSDGTTSFFQVRNGQDGSATWDQINSKAPIISETTASSAIATFADGADDIPMQSVLANIEPVQDLSNGNPSPTNICPITGHTAVNVTRGGKNLADFEDLSVPTGTDAAATLGSVSLKAGTYTLSYTLDTTVTATRNRPYYMLNNSKIYGSDLKTAGRGSWTFTLSSDSTLTFYWWYHTVSSACTISDFMLEVGSTATDYEEYVTPSTVSVSWTTEAGTVYGGTIDVATGLLTVDRQSAIADGSTIKVEGIYANGVAYTNNVQDMYNDSSYQYQREARILCDKLMASPFINISQNSYAVAHSGGRRACFNIPSCTTVAEFNTWLADNQPQLVYYLATPQTYLLTPQQLMTLLGTNNVWSDLGDVSVTYPADTKMFIENLTQPTEDDLVANQAITSGKYFMIGNSLYLALANIASGAQITIGTNAQRVSLADALNTINA